MIASRLSALLLNSLFTLLLALLSGSLIVSGARSRPLLDYPSISALPQGLIQIIRDPNGNALLTREDQFKSANWSGYVLAQFDTRESSAQGTWIVPTVVFKKTQAVSANWVGIGGFCGNMECTGVDPTLIQLGTAQEALSRKRTKYFAWYEMLPGPPQLIPLTINPTDLITASLSCAGACTNAQKWTLSMTNQTSGLSWSQDFTYQSYLLSADWIVEAPTDRHGILPLADYGTTTFDQSMTNGVTADLPMAEIVIMLDPHHQTSDLSYFDTTFDGFSACFGTHKVLEPCPFVPLP